MPDVYAMSYAQVRQLAILRGIDPDKFPEATLRRMLETRLRREERGA